ncbi:hypothetical protein G7Y79_00001g000290 [Physcia stellaris]|nr:hypothetical protein G7Y79_00001g000290 [Physcia stellaris]
MKLCHLLLTTVLIVFPTFTVSYQCFETPFLLPGFHDCRAVIAGIYYISRLPHESQTRAWGRHVPHNSGSESLPKLFWIEGRRPPSTCAVEVDVDPLDIWAVEKFTLHDIAVAAERVYLGCLLDRGLAGLEYPKREGIRRVWAKIVRIDSSLINNVKIMKGLEEEDGHIRKVKVGNFGGDLMIADRRSTAPDARRMSSQGHLGVGRPISASKIAET